MQRLRALSPDRIRTACEWALAPRAQVDDDAVSATRDAFRARLDRFYRQMAQTMAPESDAALMTAVVGEIGNNCFDHNLGQWRDQPGCWFEWGVLPKSETIGVVISDRGQGIRASLARVDASLQTDQMAVDAAFSKILSGRSPEKRGNGLKFVRQIVNGESRRGLLFVSGTGRITLGRLGSDADRASAHALRAGAVVGTWALLVSGGGAHLEN